MFRAYLLTCVPTGEVYVGVTTQELRLRFNQHMAGPNSSGKKVKMRVKQYGRDGFKIEEIASAKSRADLRCLEEILIEQYDSRRTGLNSTSGGDGAAGLRHGRTSREKMSSARKANWSDPAYRAKIAASQKAAWARKSESELVARRERARVLLTDRWASRRNHTS